MSLNLNKVTLAGRLTRDPEVKVITNNRTVANMGVAINRKWKDKDGTAKEEVTFIDVAAWGKTAEFCGQFLHKGSGVYIEGHLKMDAWKTTDGQARQMLKVEATNVLFTDAKPAEAAPKRSVTSAPDPFDDEPPL